MAQRRELGLRRGVGLGSIASIVFVNIAAAVFLVLGVTAREALGVTPVVFIAAGIVFLLVLVTYVEGIAMLPTSGGAAGFAKRGFNDLVSFLAAWALILDYVILVAMTAYFATHYLGSVPGFHLLLSSPWDGIVSVTLVVLIALLNARKVRLGAMIIIVVALLALVSQVLLALIGLITTYKPGVIANTVHLGVTPTWDGLIFALPIAMIGFIGLDSVANFGAELERPGRDVPRPLIWSALISVTVFVLMSILGLTVLPVTGTGSFATSQLSADSGYIDRPLIGIIEALPIGQGAEHVLVIVMALLAAAVLFLAASSGVAGLSRVTYFLSTHRQAPSALARIKRDAGVPIMAVVLYSALSIGVLVVTLSLRHSALALAQLFAFGAMLSFMLGSAAIINLRRREPDLERPFRAPLNIRIGTTDISLVSVAALIAASGMWLIVLLTHDDARALGITWMVLGFVLYSIYRLGHGFSLTKAVTEQKTVPFDIEVVQYRKLLLAIRPERGMLWGDGDAELAALAQKLMDQENGEVTAMVVHELPLTEPLTAPLSHEQEVISKRLTLLRAATERLNLRLSSTITRARAAGRAICQEAERRDADAVILAMRTKERIGDQAFGKCVAYVLRHAPCDVVVLALPEATLRSTAVRTPPHDPVEATPAAGKE